MVNLFKKLNILQKTKRKMKKIPNIRLKMMMGSSPIITCAQSPLRRSNWFVLQIVEALTSPHTQIYHMQYFKAALRG